MTKIIVSGFSISLDGYGAGINQSLINPIGENGTGLHNWLRATQMFHKMIGKEGGLEGIDNDYAIQSMAECGAFIMGRNMFTPERGEWSDSEWRGWWGDNPPYHAPTFILTHYPRAPIEMEGGTTFYFISDGIISALEKAKALSNGKNVKIAGGVSTVRQYLQAGLVDELHIAISPVFLGSGAEIFKDINIPALGFVVAKKDITENATHIILRK